MTCTSISVCLGTLPTKAEPSFRTTEERPYSLGDDSSRIHHGLEELGWFQALGHNGKVRALHPTLGADFVALQAGSLITEYQASLDGVTARNAEGGYVVGILSQKGGGSGLGLGILRFGKSKVSI